MKKPNPLPASGNAGSSSVPRVEGPAAGSGAGAIEIWHPVGAMLLCITPGCDRPCYVRTEHLIPVEAQLRRARELILAFYTERKVIASSLLRDRAYDFLRELETCEECNAYDRVHDHRCPLHPDHDPTPE